MFLVVQHVATAEQDGVNAYVHEHGVRDDWEWGLRPGSQTRIFMRFEVEEALRYDWRAELRRLLDLGAERLAAASHR